MLLLIAVIQFVLLYALMTSVQGIPAKHRTLIPIICLPLFPLYDDTNGIHRNKVVPTLKPLYFFSSTS